MENSITLQPEPTTMTLHRREFIQSASLASASLVSVSLPQSESFLQAANASDFRFKYLLASCMYGYTDLDEIVPEVAKVGASAIDLWPMVHGNQREQLDKIGEEKFASILKRNQTGLGCITQYKLGPFGLQDEMRLAQRFGCKTIVTGAKGPINLTGAELKQAVAKFIEEMKPHLAVAEETGVTIAIENHARNLIDSPDSLRYLTELSPSKNLGIAFAPYHLPQDEKALAGLLRDVIESLHVFYGWEHGNGCMTKLPKEEELLQMPGRGKLDFTPMVSILKAHNYQGWTEIFMHPFPRGVPILETTSAVTTEINRSRSYLDKCLMNAS